MDHSPSTLAEIVGQPKLTVFRQWARNPYARNWLFRGAGGTGKNATATALANEIGADITPTCGAKLNMEDVTELRRTLQCRPMFGRWRLWQIDEMEKLHPRVEAVMKDWLQPGEHGKQPDHLIVIATTNVEREVKPTDEHAAFLQRFDEVAFNSSNTLADAFRDVLLRRWNDATAGAPLPKGWTRIGWYSDGGNDKAGYSARLALRRLRDEIDAWQAEHCACGEACCIPGMALVGAV